MGKFLLFFVIGLAVWFLLRRALGARKPPAPPAETRAGEDFVACSRCGVNLPRSEARVESGRFFCLDQKTCKHAG
jgi:uncharacterized protein